MKFGKGSILALVATSILFLGSAQGQDKESVKIGVPTPLTGPLGDLGNQVRRAVMFAVDQANIAGDVDGRKVEARFSDDEARADLARRQGEKLALSGFNLLVGTVTSGEGLAMAPMLERWDALYLSTINKANELTGASCVGRMFRANRPDNNDAAAIKPWLELRKEMKWAVIATDSAWGRNSSASFAAVAKKLGKSVVYDGYPPVGTSDFAPYIQAVVGAGADGIWIPLSGRDAIGFINQAHQFGLLTKVVAAGVSATTDATVKAIGERSKGIWTVINYSSTLDTPENKKFVEDWAKKYPGTWPTNFEGETYIGMQVLFQAIKKAGSVKPRDVARALSGGTFETILGKQVMRAEDHQLIGPNYFGIVEHVDDVLRPVIKMTVPEEIATVSPDGSCQMVKN